MWIGLILSSKYWHFLKWSVTPHLLLGWQSRAWDLRSWARYRWCALLSIWRAALTPRLNLRVGSFPAEHSFNHLLVLVGLKEGCHLHVPWMVNGATPLQSTWDLSSDLEQYVLIRDHRSLWVHHWLQACGAQGPRRSRLHLRISVNFYFGLFALLGWGRQAFWVCGRLIKGVYFFHIWLWGWQRNT